MSSIGQSVEKALEKLYNITKTVIPYYYIIL